MKDPKKVQMGKKSRAAGKRFEARVRKDIEKKGFIVDRWTNNIDLVETFTVHSTTEIESEKLTVTGKIVPAKQKFRGPGIPLSIATGFPDFIGFKFSNGYGKQVIGVECKMDGKLDSLEKKKANWLVEEKVFNELYVAQKGEKRGEIKYVEWKN